MTSRALLVLAGLALFGCSGAVDTLLGLDATVSAASVAVRADPGGDVVSASLDVDYRNGEHTDGPRDFEPQRIDVYVADAPVAQITPQLPADFTITLAPGDSSSATLTGESRPGVATDPRRLCGADARLLFRWQDGTSGDIGMVEATTSDVTCD